MLIAIQRLETIAASCSVTCPQSGTTHSLIAPSKVEPNTNEPAHPQPGFLLSNRHWYEWRGQRVLSAHGMQRGTLREGAG